MHLHLFTSNKKNYTQKIIQSTLNLRLGMQEYQQYALISDSTKYI
jgi:hypothetical protein